MHNQPYLVDAGEGIWRALAKAALIHGDEINNALAPVKLNYLFVTHLHEDHTVGIPSLWGGDTVEEKKKEIFRYHFSPAVLARIATEAKVEAIVLSHEQNYVASENFRRTGLKDEIIEAGFEGTIYSAMDGDIY